MASDVVGPPSFLRYATVTALVSVAVGLGVVGTYVKNSGTGASATRDTYCWKTSSGQGLCINEVGGIRSSGSITTQGQLINSGSVAITAGQGLTKNGESIKLNAIITGSLVSFTNISGSAVYAKNTLASSGSLEVLGEGSGRLIHASDNITSSGGLEAKNTVLLGSGIVSTRTTNIGWSVKSGADTACNTTCTFACVLGFADAVTGDTAVACTDATADRCLCAGGS